MTFDYQAAKNAGYSDQEIQDYLKPQGQVQVVGGPDKLPGWVHALLPALAGTGGAIAGAGLGAMVPGADLSGLPEYAGGVAGAGLGTALGQGAVNGIEHAMGGNAPATMQGQLGSMGQAGKSGAAAEAIGVPVAKGLGLLAHPIKPLIDYIDQQLAKSPATVDVMSNNPSSLLSRFVPEAQQKYASQGHGTNVAPALNSLQSRLSAMVDSRTPQVAAQNSTNGIAPQIQLGQLPISQANGVRRNLDQMVYNPDPDVRIKGTEAQMTKDFVNNLRSTIKDQSPAGVNAATTLASWGYKLPDILSTIAHLLPGGAGNAAQKVGALPFEGIQKAIPANGGYLKTALPFVGNLGANGQAYQQY